MIDLLIGKRINDRYKIIEMIGGGGMANVYLAHDVILDRDVAVKVLRLDFANDEDFIRRFRREAQSATSLAHPNIVNIYDVGEEESIYYIVMEYVDGQTLKQFIQKNSPVDVDVALNIMQQLTSAISHAHQNHIIHRDIKPQNILIDREGNVKITDFGIAVALSATSITQTNSVLGSVHYLSPEQARGGMANRKSDIYSLGIVMFELLTGRLPFSGESAVSIALKHLQSETPSIRRWNPSIPQSVENIVLKATAKDPFYRYNSAEEMELDIVTALDPTRVNEEKYIVPVDDEATKAIPVITKDIPFEDLDETVIRGGKEQPLKSNGVKKDKTVEPEKKKKRTKRLTTILVSTFIVLVILGISIVTILPDLISPDDVEIPSLVNVELEEAIKQLEELGLMVDETIELNDEEIPAGYVIRTDPREGRVVKEGSEIDIFVSIGKETVELDDYVGRSFDEVYAFLLREGFKDVIKNEVYDDAVAVGLIIEQSILPGDKVVPEETVIEFTVSKGPELIVLKDLVEYNAKGLQEYASSVGLFIEIAPEGEYHEKIPEGLVISQDPPPGTELKKGDKVTVILSKGKKVIPPKVVTREIYIPYEPEEIGLPQTVTIYIDDIYYDITEPYLVFEIYEPKVQTITLNVAHDQRAGFKVMLGDKVIYNEQVDYPEGEN